MKRTKNQAIYTLMHKFFSDESDEPQPQFSFHATSEEDALSKAKGWARYHSYSQSSVCVRPANQNEAANWLHDEWVD